MLQRLKAIIASSRKALLLYVAWLIFIALQVVSTAGALAKCWINAACSWAAFIGIIQGGIEKVGEITVALGALLPALMALEDAATKFGLPPAQSPTVHVETSPNGASAEVTFTPGAGSGTLVVTKDKESERVSIIQKNVPVSDPAYKLLKVLEEALCDLLEGKPAAELGQDFSQAVALLGQLSEIPKDYETEPEAVQNAIYLAGDDLIKRVVAIIKKKNASTPTPLGE